MPFRQIVDTDHVWRPILSYYELSEEQQKQVDDDYEWDDEHEGPFFCDDDKYGGYVYHMSTFMKIDPPPNSIEHGWHAALCESTWSAHLIKINKEGDKIMLGYTYSKYILDGEDNF